MKMWFCGHYCGLPVTWYAPGWMPMQMDDYGNAVRVFSDMPREWPYGWVANASKAVIINANII